MSKFDVVSRAEISELESGRREKTVETRCDEGLRASKTIQDGLNSGTQIQLRHLQNSYGLMSKSMTDPDEDLVAHSCTRGSPAARRSKVSNLVLKYIVEGIRAYFFIILL